MLQAEKTFHRWCVAITLGVVAFVVYVSFVPFELIRPQMTFADLLQTARGAGFSARGNSLANAIMFVPFGFFGAATLVDERSPLWKWLAAFAVVFVAALTFSVGVESGQRYV